MPPCKPYFKFSLIGISLLLVLLPTTRLTAQNEVVNKRNGTKGKPYGYIGLGGGFSLLTGSIAREGGDNPGYAQNGFDVHAHGAYFFPSFKYAGLGASVGFNQYEVNETPSIKDIVPESSDPWFYWIIWQEVHSVETQWRSTYFTVGPVLTYSLGKFSVDLNLQVGRLYLTQPELNAVWEGYTSYEGDLGMSKDVQAPATTEHAFVFNGGLALRFQLVSRLAIRASINSMQTEFRFSREVTQVRENSTVPPYVYEEKRKLSYNADYVGLGLVWNFNK